MDLYPGSNLSRIIDDQSWNIARSRCQIDHAQFVGRPDPTANKTEYKLIASEPTIQLPKVLQIALQIGGRRLIPIHHLQYSGIETSFHLIESRIHERHALSATAIGHGYCDRNFCHD